MMKHALQYHNTNVIYVFSQMVLGLSDDICKYALESLLFATLI